MIGRRVYLSEGVYARYTENGIELTLKTGVEGTQRIFLDENAIYTLDLFKHQILKWLAKNPILTHGEKEDGKNSGI